jgi:hypothetical protein
LEDVAPLISMQLGGPTLDGLSLLFDQYVDMLIKAVPSPGEDEEGGAENGDDRKVGLLEADIAGYSYAYIAGFKRALH